MFTCDCHPGHATRQIVVDYAVYECGGGHRGCGSFAHLASGGGPPDPCPNCGRGWTRTGKIQLALGYCDMCFTEGYPDYAKPSYIPVQVVGGFVTLK